MPMFYREKVCPGDHSHKHQWDCNTQPHTMVEHPSRIDLLAEAFGEQIVPEEDYFVSQRAAEQMVQGYLHFIHQSNTFNPN